MPAATPDKPGKVYVGNLPPAIEKEQLQEAFSKYGEIDNVLMVVDRETGASKGFAFVTYSNPKDADDAVSGMNESTFRGKQLKVDHALMAISRQMGGRGGGDRGRGRGGPGGYGRGALLGGPPRGGGFRGRDGPRGGGRGGYEGRGGYGGRGGYESRGGYEPRGRGGFRGGPPRGRGGPPGRGGPRGGGGYNGPQGRPLMGGDDYGEERGMGRGAPRGGPRGRGRAEPLLSQPPTLMGEDYRGAARERDDYRDPMAERGGRAPRGGAPPREDYGREPAQEYGAGGRPAAREYPESRGEYGREEPYGGASRDRGGYGAAREPLAREPLVRDPPAREPAAREQRGYSRDYSATGGRDAYTAPSRDPYAAPAAPERTSYDYGQAREDPYSARSAAPAARSAYEEPRSEAPRDYERPGADRGYGKEYSSYSEPARTADPYSRAAAPERDFGAGSAPTSRYEGYGSRDPYGSRADRGDKAPYGSRDPYAAAGGAPPARSGRNNGPMGGSSGGGRGFDRHY